MKINLEKKFDTIIEVDTTYIATEAGHPRVYYKINPKAITMNQLYGDFDPNTREFIDGVLPNLYRNAASDTSPDLIKSTSWVFIISLFFLVCKCG